MKPGALSEYGLWFLEYVRTIELISCLILNAHSSLLGGVLLPMNLINGTRPVAYKTVVTFIAAGVAFYSRFYYVWTLRQA